MGVKTLDAWARLWKMTLDGASGFVDTIAQLLVISMSFRLVDLMTTFRRTRQAQEIIEAGLQDDSFLIRSDCDIALLDGDRAVALAMFVAWCTLLVWPIALFFIPMLFASRDQGDWRAERMFKALIRPGKE